MFPQILTELTSLRTLLGGLANKNDVRELKTLMPAIDYKIQALTDEVTRQTTVEKSALALIQGISAQIAAAVAAAGAAAAGAAAAGAAAAGAAGAGAAGATPAQLQSLTDLATTLKANDDELQAAVTANTAAA